MFKLKKDKIKFLIPIIIVLIGITYFLIDKFNHTEEEAYSVSEDFILYGTEEKENLVSNNSHDANNNTVNKIVVHIMGEVMNEGIVDIEEGSRIIDAVNAAGGLTEYADTSKVNLAYVLKDGQKVVIPSVNDIGEQKEFVSSGSGDGIIEDDDYNNEVNGLVDINTATKQELQTLPGVGESTAQKIINYREENGDFSDIEDIKNVSGIGESKFNSIKDMITV